MLVGKYKKVRSATGANAFRGWDKWKAGDVFVGRYVGSKTNNFNADKNDRVFNVEEAFFKDGSGETFKGKNLCINYCGSLEERCSKLELEKGDLVQLEYNGVKQIQKGKMKGKDFHDISMDVVEIDGQEEESDFEGMDEL